MGAGLGFGAIFPRAWIAPAAFVLVALGARPAAADGEISPEVDWAVSQVAGDLSSITDEAEHIVYYQLYGGVTFSDAGLVNFREEGDSTGVATQDAESGRGVVVGFGAAWWWPHFDYVGCEIHWEIGTVELDAGLGDREGPNIGRFDGPTRVEFQHGHTVRLALPLRYVQPYLQAGPLFTVFATAPRSVAQNQLDVGFGLRMGAGLNVFAGRHVRLFIDYHYDIYGDAIGQSPREPDHAGDPAPARIEIDDLAVHSFVTGITFNTPGYLQGTGGYRALVGFLPLLGATVLWSILFGVALGTS